MRKKLYLDLESRSRCDLKARGSYNYAAHDSTQILIACYALDDGPVRTWRPHKGEAMPRDLRAALDNPRIDVVAHNAAFERLMMAGRVRALAPERFLCTMTQARACALPGALDDLPRALGQSMKKDWRGAELIRAHSIPQEDGSFNDDPAGMEEFARYCAQDVAAMRQSHGLMPPLSDAERELYVVSERINDTGLPIDTELCAAAIQYRDAEIADALADVARISNGALKNPRGTKLTQWVYDRVKPEVQKMMRVHRTKHRDAQDRAAASLRSSNEKNMNDQRMKRFAAETIETVSLTLDGPTREALLDMAASEPDLFLDDVVEVIELADAVSSASVAKFATMQRLVGAGDRLHGAFVMNGASQTGRFSSKGAQVHNFPRKVADEPERIRLMMKQRAQLPGAVIQTLKSMLRPAIRPQRGFVVRGDWSAIEARGLPWLANSPGSNAYLDAFKDAKRDIYVEQAVAAGLGDFRQGGKVVVLSLGYGGAEGALRAMAKGYGVDIENPSRTVGYWRAANRWAVEFWYALDRAARRALRLRDGKWCQAGRVAFMADDFGLAMLLPSGRVLRYPFARESQTGELTYLKAAWKPKSDAKEWPRAKAWHGTFAENATQAACADLLRESIVRAHKRGLPLIGHVHDELICEADTMAHAKDVAKELERCMLTLPQWGVGLPLAAEVHIARTFTK